MTLALLAGQFVDAEERQPANRPVRASASALTLPRHATCLDSLTAFLDVCTADHAT